jgi:hypothetical protein
MVVKQEACDDYLYHMDLFHRDGRTVWSDKCRSWYKNKGKVWVWPGAVSPFGFLGPMGITVSASLLTVRHPLADHPLYQNTQRGSSLGGF